MSECSVCCEKINASNHKKVVCPFCDFNSCRICVQTYLLSVTTDPHCMGCKKLWTREVVDESCTKVFRDGKLKKHRETILFEREKCLLPQTQDAANRIIRGRGIDRLIVEAQEEINRVARNIRDLQHLKNNILNGGDAAAGSENEKEKRVFVRKCPVNECRGFLSTRWKCQICENNICSECNEIKGDEHTCDPNNVETVKLLKKDTKPCPQCGTMIFKISGCSQMWCPDCHTAFDWNTMRIETGNIHNPHYYEFKRTNRNTNREHGDIPCGGMPHLDEITHFLKIPRGYHRAMIPGPSADIFKIHRLANHIQNYELNRYRVRGEDNQTLRVRYLLNEITEEEMKFILQKNEKAREKTRDCDNLLRMFCDVTSDLLRQLVVRTLTQGEFLENMTQLREYVREVFTRIHKRYTCSTDWISDGWEFVRNQYRKPREEAVVV